MSTDNKFNVAICGGGIGGLSLASFIFKFSKNIRVDIYEAGTQFSEIGAGVTVWKRTWELMQLLGLDIQLGKIAVKPPVEAPSESFLLRRGDREQGINILQMVTPYGSITVHRRDALKVLVDSLPQQVNAHFSKRLVNYRSKGAGVLLQFADGTEAEADLLVGADGIRSATRGAMYRDLSTACSYSDPVESTRLSQFIHPTWTGVYAYRCLIQTELLLERSPKHQAAVKPMMYIGKHKGVVSYPISQGKIINFAAMVLIPDGEGKRHDGPTVIEASKQDLVDIYKGWEKEVQDLIHFCDKPTRWTVNNVRGLPNFVTDRIALLGDAAHAMTPFFGAGAGQAIEDAHILGRLLSNSLVTRDTLSATLRIYEAVRRPFATQLLERSREMGLLYVLATPGYDICDDEESMGRLSAKILENWRWQWELNVEDDWTKAQGMLNAELKHSRL